MMASPRISDHVWSLMGNQSDEIARLVGDCVHRIDILTINGIRFRVVESSVHVPFYGSDHRIWIVNSITVFTVDL